LTTKDKSAHERTRGSAAVELLEGGRVLDGDAGLSANTYHLEITASRQSAHGFDVTPQRSAGSVKLRKALVVGFINILRRVVPIRGMALLKPHNGFAYGGLCQELDEADHPGRGVSLSA
jgi:hypothetical protein